MNTEKFNLEYYRTPLEKIRVATAGNHHTEAVLILADFLSAEKSKKILINISSLQNLYGYMPKALQILRDIELETLLFLLKKTYNDEVHNIFKASF